MVVVAEAAAPVAEVRRNHKQIGWVGQVWREDLPVKLLDFGIEAADQYWDDRELILEVFHHLGDVW